MFNIKLRNVVNQIVQYALFSELTPCQKDEAIYINFDVRLQYSGRTQARGLHLLYHCLPTSSYVSVFSAITKNPFASYKDVEKWKHECTHDSCWKELGVVSDLYFEMADLVNSDLRSLGRKEVAPNEMNEFVFFRGNELFQVVKVKVSKDLSDKYNYRRLVELVE